MKTEIGCRYILHSNILYRVGRTHSDLCIKGSVGSRTCLHPMAKRKVFFFHSPGMEDRFLVRPFRSLEIMLTELPGPHDREQVTFAG